MTLIRVRAARYGATMEGNMTRMLASAVAAAAVVVAPVAAGAQERLGDAALGALSGALVGGPVGAVAGGVVGFTAGPSIAHSWGLRHHPHHARTAPATRSAARTPKEGGTESR
jgi:hypothetical protein